jgi:hypothetical protein
LDFFDFFLDFEGSVDEIEDVLGKIQRIFHEES